MILLEMLAYIPVASITVQFLNRPVPPFSAEHVALVYFNFWGLQVTVQLSHQGQTPQSFKQAAAQQLQQAFRDKPIGMTPVKASTFFFFSFFPGTSSAAVWTRRY